MVIIPVFAAKLVLAKVILFTVIVACTVCAYPPWSGVEIVYVQESPSLTAVAVTGHVKTAILPGGKVLYFEGVTDPAVHVAGPDGFGSELGDTLVNMLEPLLTIIIVSRDLNPLEIEGGKANN